MESMGTGLGEIYGYPSRNNLPISFITYMHVNFAFVNYLKDDDEEEEKKKKKQSWLFHLNVFVPLWF